MSQLYLQKIKSGGTLTKVKSSGNHRFRKKFNLGFFKRLFMGNAVEISFDPHWHIIDSKYFFPKLKIKP